VSEESILVDPGHVRLIEALLFAAAEPLDVEALLSRLPPGTDLAAVLATLQRQYEGRGIQPVCVAERWTFRTAPDLAGQLQLERATRRRLSRAAIETLVVIAYHQPVTRADIEDVRGVALSKGTLDLLLEAGWIRPGRRRETPGRPITWITTDAFLEHFSLASLNDLPNVDELRAMSLFEPPPAGLSPFGPAPHAEAAGHAGESVEEPVEEEDTEASC
jgi:segregation and condensation protein B